MCFLGYSHYREMKPCRRGCISLKVLLDVIFLWNNTANYHGFDRSLAGKVLARLLFALSHRLQRQQEA